MQKEYDTAAIRSAARNLDSISSKLTTLRKNKTSSIDSSVRKLKGSTARAIDSSSDEVMNELSSISSGLSKCAKQLYEFARQLDIADEKMSQMMKS